jgi:hypothetical protein
VITSNAYSFAKIRISQPEIYIQEQANKSISSITKIGYTYERQRNFFFEICRMISNSPNSPNINNLEIHVDRNGESSVTSESEGNVDEIDKIILT